MFGKIILPIYVFLSLESWQYIISLYINFISYGLVQYWKRQCKQSRFTFFLLSCNWTYMHRPAYNIMVVVYVQHHADSAMSIMSLEPYCAIHIYRTSTMKHIFGGGRKVRTPLTSLLLQDLFSHGDEAVGCVKSVHAYYLSFISYPWHKDQNVKSLGLYSDYWVWFHTFTIEP